MNELHLYKLLELVVDKSEVIKGGFHILENAGDDLNSNSFNEVVKVALDTIGQPKDKYPVVVMFPPVEYLSEVPVPNDPYWASYKAKIYFLTTTYSERGGVKFRNPKTNTSDHPIKWDWSDMRHEAIRFLQYFEKASQKLCRQIQIADDDEIKIHRYSEVQNDRLSGVSLEIEFLIGTRCEDLADDQEVVSIVNELNEFETHKPHS